ncbi:hypothetical protein DRQ53_03040 [bacterium]|nr:MAG: hypothetical protein DRQ32_02870 [bacterium]RKZ17575.1 MAG: hypothetical protein DRQ53_03040 [bacterium]
MKNPRLNSVCLITTFTLGLTLGAAGAGLNDASASLLLYCTMDDAQAIFDPEVAAGTYDPLDGAIPAPEHTSYEVGQVDTAIRLDLDGYDPGPTWPVDGPVRFHGDNFDFADPGQDGGRLDFFVKFNQNPHTTSANTWLARSNWPARNINIEWSGNGGPDAVMMFDLFGEIAHNYRTNYEKFRVQPYQWDVYENISAGEWHVFTFLWRNNGGPHKAEIHVFIDGTQAGCSTCSDYNGNLPGPGTVTDFFFSPDLSGAYLLFSVDEVYSFDSWDVSGIEGNFPELQIPDGVLMKFPQHNNFPTYGSSVPKGNFDFEITVNDSQSAQCDCDLYVDGEAVRSFTATSGAHTEVTPPASIVKGTHNWQVICDNGRIVSPVHDFNVDQDVPVEPGSISRTKRAWTTERH